MIFRSLRALCFAFLLACGGSSGSSNEATDEGSTDIPSVSGDEASLVQDSTPSSTDAGVEDATAPLTVDVPATEDTSTVVTPDTTSDTTQDQQSSPDTTIAPDPGAALDSIVAPDPGAEPDPCSLCEPGTYCTPSGACAVDTTCDGLECGIAPGAGFCGFCNPGVICTDEGQCVQNCMWTCEGKQCGPNGCGGKCGSCLGNDAICSPQGLCVGPDECVPDCEGKECGDNGCGGTCGGCSDGLLCTTQSVCGNECTECGFSSACMNFGFESGNIMDGRFEGQVLILDQFGVTGPPEGNKFIKVSNAYEYKGIAQLQTCVPPGTQGLKFLWKIYSEEFLEFCHSDYTDFVRLTVSVAGAEVLDSSNSVVFERNIQEVCPLGECAECGAYGQVLVQAQVIFDAGGVYTGPWIQEYLDISNLVAEEGGTVLTIDMRAEDVGDSVYDTRALFDNLEFTSGCVPDCTGKMCGDDGCGGLCGACFDGGSGCDEGNQCCFSNCLGKQCGSDGCGGSCGDCWPGLLCLTGSCIEEKDAFGVPCNPSTDSCGTSFECVDLGDTGTICDLICDLESDFCPPGWSCGSWPTAENPVCLPN